MNDMTGRILQSGESRPGLEESAAHYGYDVSALKDWHSCWPNAPEQIERLAGLPEFIKMSGLENQRFRITFDYDPDYPNMLLRAATVSSNPGS